MKLNRIFFNIFNGQLKFRFRLFSSNLPKKFYANYTCDISNISATVDYIQKNYDTFKVFSLPKDMRSSHAAFVGNSDPDKAMFLFKNGTIAYWNLSPKEIKLIQRLVWNCNLKGKDERLIDEYKDLEDFKEYVEIENGTSRVVSDTVCLKASKTENEKMQLFLEKFAVSEALCLSVKLNVFEKKFDQLIPWIKNNMVVEYQIPENYFNRQIYKLKRFFHLLKQQLNKNDLNKVLQVMDIQCELTVTQTMDELPDHYWERPDLETLFVTTKNTMDIRRRTRALKEKVELCISNIKDYESDKRHAKNVFISVVIIELIALGIFIEICKFSFYSR